MAVPLNMKIYRYNIEAFDILLPGSDPVKVESSQINSILIEKDYDRSFFPVIGLNLMLDTSVYQLIIANKLTVRFRLRLQKYIYDENQNFQVKKDVVNAIFCIFENENTPYMDKSMYDRTKEMTDTDKTPQSISGEQQELFLYKEKDVLGAHQVMNAVLSQATMSDAITYLLSSSGFTSGVLMSPLDNQQSYPEVIIPPFTLLGSLDHLEAQYGFYSRRALLFFDLDRIYFIKQQSKPTAWASQEYTKTIFNIKKPINSDNFSQGTYEDTAEKTFYINIPPTAISMFSPSITNDIMEGNNLIVVTPGTGSVTRVNPNTVQMGKGTSKVLIDNLANRYAVDAERIRREEAGNMISLMIGDHDIEAISPNKQFMFTFEDVEIQRNHGGTYRISKSVITLVKQGEEFSISSQNIFSKTT